MCITVPSHQSTLWFVAVLMGKEVVGLLNRHEQRLQESKGGLDGIINQANCSRLLPQLKAVCSALSAAPPSGTSAAAVALSQQLCCHEPVEKILHMVICGRVKQAQSLAAAVAAAGGAHYAHKKLRETIRVLDRKRARYDRQVRRKFS